MNKNIFFKFKSNPFDKANVAVSKLTKAVTATGISFKTNRYKTNGNFSNIVNNFNLKQFGGKNDVDFDGVINRFDCNPFSVMRQDFSPFRDQSKAEQMTAARRFGGQNIKGFQKLGQGRDRVVYALDKDKVLKVAKNPGGLTQNTSESDLVYLGMGEQLEYGKDYVVMKRQQPLSKEGRQKLAKVRKFTDENIKNIGYRHDLSPLLNDDSVLDQVGIGKDILDFQPNPKEVFANRQWGEDEQGNLVLLDGGALQDTRSLSKFRVKDYKSEDWQYQEWQDVQQQRKQFKDKGNYDKQRKFNKGYLEGEWKNIPIEQDYYHGTSRKNAEQIAKEGLTPQGGEKTTNFTEDGYIYATPYKQYAEGYARENFQDPILLKTRQPVGLFDNDRKYKGIIKPDEIFVTDDIPKPEEAHDANQPNNNFKQNYKKLSEFFNVDEQLKGKYNIEEYSQPASYNEDVNINTFKRPGGKLEITEYPDGAASVSSLYVDEDYRRQGIATELLEKAKNKYSNIHAQVSNIPSVKTHFRAGFRADENPNMSEEETIEYFKEKETGPGSIGMVFNKQVSQSTNNALFGDDDGDGVLNYNDCVVDDPNRQGPWHSKQTLWHAGDKPPSQTLKDEGRVFGFSSKQYADGWKEKHNKQNVYKFTTDNYELDNKSYVRPLPGGKKTMSDNEYISLEVEDEDIVEDTLQVPPGQLTLAEQQKLKSYMFLNEANDDSPYTFRVVDKRDSKVIMKATSKKDGSSYTYEIDESEL